MRMLTVLVVALGLFRAAGPLHRKYTRADWAKSLAKNSRRIVQFGLALVEE